MNLCDKKIIKSYRSSARLLCIYLGGFTFLGGLVFLLSYYYIIMALFVICIIYLLIILIEKLSNKTYGLILSKKGIIDDSDIFSSNFIPWSVITGFDVRNKEKEFKYFGDNNFDSYWYNDTERHLIIKLTNPSKCIEKIHFSRGVDYKTYEYPVFYILLNTLEMNYDDVLKVCNEFLEKYG